MSCFAFMLVPDTPVCAPTSIFYRPLQVRLCKDRTTNQQFAMKIISKEMLKKKKNGHTSETYFEDIRREIAIMKKLMHPNVLRLFEVLDDPNVRCAWVSVVHAHSIVSVDIAVSDFMTVSVAMTLHLMVSVTMYL
jgi:serine/threonine protein kinase